MLSLRLILKVRFSAKPLARQGEGDMNTAQIPEGVRTGVRSGCKVDAV